MNHFYYYCLVSGLNRTNLLHQKDFDATAAELIELFLTSLDPPVCLLSNNGYRFAFELLDAELRHAKGKDFTLSDCKGNPICCSDTLRLSDGNSRPSHICIW